jgi:hypothetical protein
LGGANDLAAYRLDALVRRIKELFKEMHRRSYSYHSSPTHILANKFTAVTQFVTHVQLGSHRERALCDVKPLKLG